jgi:hypothetical protein
VPFDNPAELTRAGRPQYHTFVGRHYCQN